MGTVNYRWRVNGVIIPQIRVRREIIDGVPKGRRQVVVSDPSLAALFGEKNDAWFAIDENENLWDPALPRFEFEIKDLSAPLFKRTWKKVTIAELFQVLESIGVLK